MNTEKAGNYGRIIAFVLVATILIGIFGFAAEGWQSMEQNESDNGKIDSGNDETDENNDGTENNPDVPEGPYIPDYVNLLTGLETTEELARLRPICFVMNTTSPLYGISGAELTVELPTEDGTTRLLSFTSNSRELGKIGSLAPTRGYISNIAKYFGAILVSAGSDDTVEYDRQDVSSSHFDLGAYSGYHYTEYTHFVYTNGALVNAGIANANIGTAVNTRQTLPYLFPDFGSERIFGTLSARNVILPFSSSSETELYYSDTDGKYTLSKGGVTKTDMLTDEAVTYDNVFVLFADTVTYENASGSEMVMNTATCGTGYYVTGGTAMNIRWEAGAGGAMVFYNEAGERLTVNRGNSYIGFIKSSLTDTVKFS